MKDLFGDDSPIIEKSKKGDTILSRWTRLTKYRKSEGPEKCKNCYYCRVRRMGNTYYKCVLIGCGGSMSTDIRANHVCNRYKSEE